LKNTNSYKISTAILQIGVDELQSMVDGDREYPQGTLLRRVLSTMLDAKSVIAKRRGV